jgi:DNA-binding transcriptional LysR family regulator
MAGEPRGLLRVHAPVSLGAHMLAPLLARYVRRYPQVEIDFVLADRDVNLIDEGFDVTVSIARHICRFHGRGVAGYASARIPRTSENKCQIA